MKLGIILMSLFMVACTDQTDYTLEALPDDMVIDQLSNSTATYAWPSSIEDLEERSDNIVKAKMNGMIEVGNHDEQSDITARITSTLSEIEITEVFKGDLSIGDKTVVTELFYIMGGQLTTIAHYMPMEQDEEYLLFLTNWDGESWALNYMGFGKYHFEKDSLTDSIQNYETLSEIRHIQFMSEEDEEVALYQSLFEEIEQKYNDPDH